MTRNLEHGASIHVTEPGHVIDAIVPVPPNRSPPVAGDRRAYTAAVTYECDRPRAAPHQAGRADRGHYRPAGRRVAPDCVQGPQWTGRGGDRHPTPGGGAAGRARLPPARRHQPGRGAGGGLLLTARATGALEVMRGVERPSRRIASWRSASPRSGDATGPPGLARAGPGPAAHRRHRRLCAVHSGRPGPARGQRIPLVALGPTSEPLHSTPSVGATNRAGGAAAAQHLLDLGHRRIAMIGGPDTYLCAQARLAGVRSALAGAGVPLDPALLRVGRYSFEDGLGPRPRALLSGCRRGRPRSSAPTTCRPSASTRPPARSACGCRVT